MALTDYIPVVLFGISALLLCRDLKNKMTKNQQPRATRRFREAIDGPEIRRRYAYEPTEVIARDMGLTVKQIMNYVYRHNTEPWARKSPSLLAKMNSANGRNGGRPQKKS